MSISPESRRVLATLIQYQDPPSREELEKYFNDELGINPRYILVAEAEGLVEERFGEDGIGMYLTERGYQAIVKALSLKILRMDDQLDTLWRLVVGTP